MNTNTTSVCIWYQDDSINLALFHRSHHSCTWKTVPTNTLVIICAICYGYTITMIKDRKKTSSSFLLWLEGPKNALCPVWLKLHGQVVLEKCLKFRQCIFLICCYFHFEKGVNLIWILFTQRCLVPSLAELALWFWTGR